MSLKKLFGPYRVVGFHAEDYPSLDPDGKPLTFKVKELVQGFVVDEAGRRWETGRQGATVSVEGQDHYVYRNDKKIAATQLNPGDVAVLAHEETFGPCRPVGKGGKPTGEHVPVGSPQVVEELARKGFQFKPFMSANDLELLNQPPHDMKYWRATDVAQADEIKALRAQIEALEARIADRQTQAAQVGQEQNKPAPQHQQGKRQPQPVG